jgi:L-lysine exporter family protein LysE/ArgO
VFSLKLNSNTATSINYNGYLSDFLLLTCKITRKCVVGASTTGFCVYLLHMIYQYILLGFVFAAGIGPVNIETAKRGLTEATSSAFLFYLGNVVIDALYILIIMFGFSTFVESTVLKAVFGVFGIAYLAYLGVENIRDGLKKGAFKFKKDTTKKKMNPLLAGVLVNLANPTAIASWLAFYSVVSADFGKSFLNFSAVVFGATLLGVVIVFVTHFFKRVVSEKVMRGVSLVSGLVLIGFSCLFVWNLVGLVK